MGGKVGKAIKLYQNRFQIFNTVNLLILYNFFYIKTVTGVKRHTTPGTSY